jgi:pyruvate formate lyase activating enzyme
VDEVLSEVEKDRLFFEESGGGLTLSGGEPLAHFEFTRALLAAAHERGLHTCLETSGFAVADLVRAILPVTDLLLWDLKDTDPDRHNRQTGVPLQPILDNLRLAASLGARMIIRCILLAGMNLNRAHLDGIGSLCRDLPALQGVELLPFHLLGDAKLARLGLPRTQQESWVPTPAQMRAAREYLAETWHVGCRDQGDDGAIQ